MSYHQLTQYQRHELGALLSGNKHSLREIGRLLGFHHSTISREIRRHQWSNASGYHAIQARLQLKQVRQQANQHHRKLPTNSRLVAVVTAKLRRHDSPDQIAGWLKDSGAKLRVCAQTIYDWIYTHAQELVVHLHCRKGKYRRTRQSTLRKAFRDRQNSCRSIDARPMHIQARRTYGHWEGDTVVGTGHTGCIATFVERKSGYLMAVKLEHGTAAAFEQAAKQCFSSISARYRLTLTLDNGVEMSNYDAMEQQNQLQVYFAHPYHSWERGTNENTNGLLRQYFPKRSNLGLATQVQLDHAVSLLNTRPRKRLDYRTPAAMFEKQW
jgi:IS30 family transposase